MYELKKKKPFLHLTSSTAVFSSFHIQHSVSLMFCEAVVNAVFVLLYSHKVSSFLCPTTDTLSLSGELSRLAVKFCSTVVNGTGCSSWYTDLSLFQALKYLVWNAFSPYPRGNSAYPFDGMKGVLISLLSRALKCIIPAEFMAMCQKQQELRRC